MPKQINPIPIKLDVERKGPMFKSYEGDLRFCIDWCFTTAHITHSAEQKRLGLEYVRKLQDLLRNHYDAQSDSVDA